MNRSHGSVAATLSPTEAADRQWDVVVVGAGPAGSVAAHQIAVAGADVLLLDRDTFPRWKVCGCCLNGAALASLEGIGLGDLATSLGARPVRSWQLYGKAGHVSSALHVGCSLSRSAFDAELIRSAISVGAEFIDQAQAKLASSNAADRETARKIKLRYQSETFELNSKIVIAADGLSGRLLDDEDGFEVTVHSRSRVGAGTVIEEAPSFYDDGTIYMACGSRGYVGLVRLEDDQLDIAAALDLDAIRDAGSPALAAAQVLEQSKLPVPESMETSTWKGTPALTRHRTNVARRRVIVIGDAAGYVEPFTGEGIAWAINTAAAVAPIAAAAINDWSPQVEREWEHTYRRIVGKRKRNCRFIGNLLKRPRLANLTLRTLRIAPWLVKPTIRAINRPMS